MERKEKMKLPTLLELLQAGVYFGHQKSRWHPNARDYVFIERGGFHIIDLEKTLAGLEAATEFVGNLAKRGGLILFLGTKKQAREIVKKYAQEAKMPCLTERWIGGMFTNFSSVGKLIKRYQNLKTKQKSGALNKYTKKEQLEFSKEIDKLEKLIGGAAELAKLPDALFVVDPKRQKTAISEARKKKIPIIGFADTNVNPEILDYPIPANDDAVKSIEIIVKTIAGAVVENLSAGKKAVQDK